MNPYSNRSGRRLLQFNIPPNENTSIVPPFLDEDPTMQFSSDDERLPDRSDNYRTGEQGDRCQERSRGSWRNYVRNHAMSHHFREGASVSTGPSSGRLEYGLRQYREEFAVLLQPRTHKFETIDFRTPPSKLNVDNLLSRTRKEERIRELFLHLVAAAVGLVVGIAAFGADQAIKQIQFAIYTVTATFFRNNRINAAVFFTMLSALLVVSSSIMILYLSPVSSGSGVPEIKALLNGVNVPGFLRFKTFVVKTLSLLLCLGGGLLSGKQGPFNHIGAIIGAGLSQGASSTFHFRIHSNLWRPLRTAEVKRDFVAIGSAVGVAVAYGAPLGGTLWTLEEAVTHLSLPLTWITTIGCLVGVLAAGSFENLTQGMPMSISFTQIGDSFRAPSLQMLDIAFFLILGVIGGVSGALYPVLFRWITLWRHKYLANRLVRVLEALLISVLISVLRFSIPLMFSDCILLSELQGNSSEYIPAKVYSGHSCSEGHVSPASAVIFGPLSETLRVLLFNSNPERFSIKLLVVTQVYYMVFTLVSNGIAAPIGIFAPAMVIGALYGRVCGLLVHRAFPGNAGDIQSYALVGCVAALSGMTRLSISVCVLVLEATGASLMQGFPTVLSSISAKFLADSLTLGVFDVQIELKGLPVVSGKDRHPHLHNTTIVRDVMSPRVIAVPTKANIGDYLEILQHHKHNSFPVYAKRKKEQQRRGNPLNILSSADSTAAMTAMVPQSRLPPLVADSQGIIRRVRGSALTEDGPISLFSPRGMAAIDAAYDGGRLDGMIDRQSLLGVVEHCCQRLHGDPNWKWSGAALSREEFDTAWPNVDREARETDIVNEVSEVAAACEIDLSDILDPNPLLISDAATTGEVRKLLRLTGARHALAVYTRRGRLVGIVTRKDITPEALEEFRNRDRGLNTTLNV